MFLAFVIGTATASIGTHQSCVTINPVLWDEFYPVDAADRPCCQPSVLNDTDDDYYPCNGLLLNNSVTSSQNQ